MATKRKRRWLRFSLRTLLIVMTLVCVCLAWLIIQVQQAHKQRVAVEWVLKNGGAVVYDWEPDANEPPGPRWLRNWIGDEYFQAVVHVYLSGSAVADVSPLSNLSQMEKLYLDATAVADTSPLSRLTQLQHLSLRNTQVRDASPLKDVPSLRTLLLPVSVSDSQLQELQRALPKCHHIGR